MLEYICRKIKSFENNGYLDNLRNRTPNYDTYHYTALVYINDWYKYIHYLSDDNDKSLIVDFIAGVKSGSYYLNKSASLDKVQEITELLNKYK